MFDILKMATKWTLILIGLSLVLGAVDSLAGCEHEGGGGEEEYEAYRGN